MNDSLEHLPELLRFIQDYKGSMPYFLSDNHVLKTLKLPQPKKNGIGMKKFNWYTRLVELGVLVDLGSVITNFLGTSTNHIEFDVSPAYKDALIIRYLI